MAKSKNILFVDEDKSQLAKLSKMVSPMKSRWDVSYASSAEEVKQQLQTRPFDVVATDFNMNGYENEELLKEIKKRQPGAIRFIISESINSSNSLQFVNYAHQFITKPCTSAELIDKIKKSLRLKNIFLNERAAKAIASIEELPSMPDLYLRLEQKLKNDDVIISDIGKLIGEDISMTASILKLVNSPFFGLFSKVTKPEQAATLLGIGTLKGLILGMHLFNSKGAAKVDFSIKELGDHCRYTALLARSIIKAEGGSNDTAENTFLAGFMHDIGKLVLSTSFADEYSTILSIVRDTNIPIQEAEKDILGYTHAEVGAYLLAIWGFNEEVVEAVYCHHELSMLGSTDLSPAVAIHIANSFDHELRVTNEGYAPHLLDAEWLEKNNFSTSLVKWLELCAHQMEDGVAN